MHIDVESQYGPAVLPSGHCLLRTPGAGPGHLPGQSPAGLPMAVTAALLFVGGPMVVPPPGNGAVAPAAAGARVAAVAVASQTIPYLAPGPCASLHTPRAGELSLRHWQPLPATQTTPPFWQQLHMSPVVYIGKAFGVGSVDGLAGVSMT